MSKLVSPHSTDCRFFLVSIALANSLSLIFPNGAVAQNTLASPQAGDPALVRMVEYLENKVRQQPSNASAWRMLGSVHRRMGNISLAARALEQALRLDAQSAASHCDYALVLLDMARRQEAAIHFSRVVDLAPQSEYAAIARTHLRGLPRPPPSSTDTSASNTSEVALAGFEVKRFDESNTLSTEAERLEDRKWTPWGWNNLSMRIESGALYNTNVTLTPTSRGFFAGEADSFQGFLNPDLEYRFINGQRWRAGGLFVGYFNRNEGPFRALDLQSYQGGMFLERSFFPAFGELAVRTQYAFTLDEFNGATFGARHGMRTSLSTFWNGGNTTSLFWSIDYTNFADDGLTPAVSSRDGWNNTLGASHRFLIGGWWLHALGFGADAQMVDTDGTDFKYNGVAVYGLVDITLAETLWMVLEGGWGYRDYFAFNLTPSRNENIWRGSVRIEKALNDYWSLAAVFNYDRFDSKNVLFQASRAVGGVATVFEY